MQAPLNIQFPAEFANNVTVSPECPPNCTYKIPFATAMHVICDLGDFVSQSVNGDEYWMELLTISMKQDGYINLVIENHFICIAIMLKGAIPNQIVGNGLLNLPAASYNIFYMPQGIHKIMLPKEEYTVLYIVPAPYHLRKMAKEHKGLEHFVNQLQYESPNALQQRS